MSPRPGGKRGVLDDPTTAERIADLERRLRLAEDRADRLARSPEPRRDEASDDQRQHAERMRRLYDASHTFAERVGDPDRLLDTIARTCSELVGDFCAITLLSDDGEWIKQAAVYHPDAELERAYRALAQSTAVRLGEGIMGKVMQDDRPVLLPEVDPEAVAARAPEPFRAAARRLNVCSLVGVPMHAHGRVIGGISMARSRTGFAYQEGDVGYLQDLANRAALALENARLQAGLTRRVAEAVAQLQATNQELVASNASLNDEIAERQRAERALERARDQAEAVSRELEAFSYSVAHDLRTPLRSIDGFSQVLLEDYGDRLDPEGRSYLDRVRNAAQHMARLIDDLLRLSRATRSELRRERVDVSALARAVVARLRDAEPGRDVEVVIAPELVASADPRLLEVVLDNVLGNAWKFTSRCPRPRIELTAIGGDHAAIYVVRDNGAGFDRAHASKLFGVFERLHGTHEFEGTGIGLATVQRLIARHGGRIWADGAVNAGATFYFTLESDGAARDVAERGADA